MHSISQWATLFLGLAVLHSFSVRKFKLIGDRFRSGSLASNFFHLLGEIEVAFGLWAAAFVFLYIWNEGQDSAIRYVDSLSFAEPIFVFAIMIIAGSRPVLELSELLIGVISKCIPGNRAAVTFATTLLIGPLLGGFITEPAAMTLTAILLREKFFEKISDRARHVSIAVLFVNVSIGGVMTSFAAPPVVMVAKAWDWNTLFMLSQFGWKAVFAISLNSLLATYFLRRDLLRVGVSQQKKNRIPLWLTVVHLAVLVCVVYFAHHPVIVTGAFLLFLAFSHVTREFQSAPKIRESLFVGCFLGGIVILGGLQAWWLAPLIAHLEPLPLYLVTAGLTAVTDNAAITYLASRIPDLSMEIKYAVMSGAVVGGGLTVIANAPNPVGYSILSPTFGPGGISPLRLFFFALPATAISMAIFWLC